MSEPLPAFDEDTSTRTRPAPVTSVVLAENSLAAEQFRLQGIATDFVVLLHAQASAVPFYRRFGFAETGPHHEEAGIVHVTMVRRLDDLSAGKG